SLSTGIISPPPFSSARNTTGPPATRLSLLARARRLPASRAATLARRPADPTTPLTTVVPAVPARSTMASVPKSTSRPTMALNCSLSSDDPPVTTTRASGWARAIAANSSEGLRAATPATSTSRPATTSRVWVPMDPVAPRMTTGRDCEVILAGSPDSHTRLRRAPSPPSAVLPRSAAAPRGRCPLLDSQQAEGTECEVRRREHQEQPVDPVEHPAVTRKHRAHVLDADRTLHHRLSEIADRGDQANDEGEDQPVDQADGIPRRERHHDRGHHGSGHQTTGEALPGLVGRELRGHLVATESASHEVGAHVVHGHHDDDEQDVLEREWPAGDGDGEGEKTDPAESEDGDGGIAERLPSRRHRHEQDGHTRGHTGPETDRGDTRLVGAHAHEDHRQEAEEGQRLVPRRAHRGVELAEGDDHDQHDEGGEPGPAQEEAPQEQPEDDDAGADPHGEVRRGGLLHGLEVLFGPEVTARHVLEADQAAVD